MTVVMRFCFKCQKDHLFLQLPNNRIVLCGELLPAWDELRNNAEYCETMEEEATEERKQARR